MKLTLFTEELRECLNAAGLSDCGENDEWNYWYQRLLKAHSESVERQTMTEVTENAKLRELVRDMWGCISHIGEYDVFYYDMAKDGCGMSCTVNGEHCYANKLCDRMRELGVDA